jgi:hypothetical protein
MQVQNHGTKKADGIAAQRHATDGESLLRHSGSLGATYFDKHKRLNWHQLRLDGTSDPIYNSITQIHLQ